MRCATCNKKIKKTAERCKHCGAENTKRVYKSNKLGNCALVFAFFLSPIGLILGVLSVVFGVLHKDKLLLRDGIISIVLSFVVTGVWIAFFIVLISMGVVAPVLIG